MATPSRAPWYDALFGRIWDAIAGADDEPLALQGGIQFTDGLNARINPATKRIEAYLADPSGGAIYWDFVPQASDPAEVEGRLFFDENENDLVLWNGLHRLSLGRELAPIFRNNTGVTIPDGSAVYLSGVSGNKPTIALASTATSLGRLIGIATHDIPDNTDGAVTWAGEADFDTSGVAADDELYLSATPGVLSATPGTPRVSLATALNSTANGRIFVHPPRLLDDLVHQDAQGALLAKSSGAGNAVVEVQPKSDLNGAQAITALANGASVTKTFVAAEEGVIQDAIRIVVKRATTGDYRTLSGVIEYTLVIFEVGEFIGTFTPAGSGDSSGLAVAVTAGAFGIDVEIANETGETVNGYVVRSAVRTDLI